MKLLEHAVIAGMPVRNRILRSATWEALADAKGYMSEKQYRIYDQLAKNEVGLICTGYARVDGEDRPNAGMMGIYDDAFIPQYQELTRRVHAYGAKIMMQIAYGGTKTTFEREGRTIFSPSAVPERKTGTVGVAMSPADIQHLIGEYPRRPFVPAQSVPQSLLQPALRCLWRFAGQSLPYRRRYHRGYPSGSGPAFPHLDQDYLFRFL